MAERERFELSVGLLLRILSRDVVSATHPPLQIYKNYVVKKQAPEPRCKKLHIELSFLFLYIFGNI